MRSDYAIAEASQAFIRLLERETGIPEEQIKLITPHDSQLDEMPQLLLMLYSITENEGLRNKEHAEPPAEDRVAREPMYLDLHYVLGAYPGQNGAGQDSSSKLLGQAMRVLYDHPQLPSSQLEGSLAHYRNGLKISLEPLSLAELDTLKPWLPMPLMPLLHYVLSPVPLLSSVTQPIRRVTRIVSHYAKLEVWP